MAGSTSEVMVVNKHVLRYLDCVIFRARELLQAKYYGAHHGSLHKEHGIALSSSWRS